MDILKTAQCNATLTHEDGEVLFAIADLSGFSTFWKPNLEELAMLQAGMPIKLTIKGQAHPKISVEVDTL